MIASRLLALRFGLSLTIALLAGLVVVSALPAQSRARNPKVYEAADGVQLPSVVREVRPSYTPAAMKRKVTGSVLLTCVVKTDGAPGDVTLIRGLDEDLDRAAIAAIKEWRFKPGTKDGKPVPVKVTVELTFTLK